MHIEPELAGLFNDLARRRAEPCATCHALALLVPHYPTNSYALHISHDAGCLIFNANHHRKETPA